MMNSSVFARSTIRSRVLTRPMRDGAYHWENVDGSVSSYFNFLFYYISINYLYYFNYFCKYCL